MRAERAFGHRQPNRATAQRSTVTVENSKSRLFRKMQSGFVQNYALVMAGGIVLVAAVYLFTKP